MTSGALGLSFTVERVGFSIEGLRCTFRGLWGLRDCGGGELRVQGSLLRANCAYLVVHHFSPGLRLMKEKRGVQS